MIRKSYNLIKRARATVLGSYLAGRFDEKHAYVLTSSPRSGSTLLANVMRAIPDSCILFEPLNIKFVRANRLLPWICQRFALPTPILLLRHPCAVIASQLNYGWKNAVRPDAPRYLERFPKFQAALSDTEGDEEYLAALWALDQIPPLLQRTPHPWKVVTYEELLLYPEATLRQIFDNWKIDINMDDALKRLKQPSSVVGKSGISGINGWKKTLSDKKISRVLRTVSSFGLSFYSRNDEADYSDLHSYQLAQRVHKAGAG